MDKTYSEIGKVLGKQREYFYSHKTKDINYRKDQLNKLYNSVVKYEKDIRNALKKDLNKSPFEAYETEIGIVLDEIRFHIKHLKQWTKPERAATPLVHFLSSSKIYKEPFGQVLIISPWNYPFQLSINPLIGAISSGNTAVLKPADYSKHTGSIIEKLVKNIFPEEYVAVFKGGREMNNALLDQKFDYIFFTGSPSMGKNVYEKAAKHLTPVTLELGGKSPVIIDKDTNIDRAAKRICWGKFLNAGQSCVAPDYIFVHRDIKDKVLKSLAKYISEFYGENPKLSKDYPRIINEKHYKRLKTFLTDGKIYSGGDYDDSELYISPTLLQNVSFDEDIMQDEIFGPLLPVFEYDSIEFVIDFINSKPKPLALYLFSKNKKVKKSVLSFISYGGGCINDTVIHFASAEIPFGGVGNSGMGRYHGKYSFDTFSNKKAVLEKSNLFDIKIKYPPYNKTKLNWIKRFLH